MNLNPDRCLVVLSGGQDSTTCLFMAKRRYKEVYALTIDYGQRHSIELEAAKKVASMAGIVLHEILHLNNAILHGSSPLVNPNEEVEHYQGPDSLPGGLEKTFVPARNMLFLTIAANRAYCQECCAIYTGVSQEDFGGYPDCRESFISRMQETITYALFNQENKKGYLEDPIKLDTPLINLNKKETVEVAMSIPGCLDALAYSHTCYDGQYPPNPHNHASILRAKGFREAGIGDPLIIRAKNEGLLPNDYPNDGLVEGTPYGEKD